MRSNSNQIDAFIEGQILYNGSKFVEEIHSLDLTDSSFKTGLLYQSQLFQLFKFFIHTSMHLLPFFNNSWIF